MIDLQENVLERTQTILYGVGMIALGFWFGAQFAGRLAYQDQLENADLAKLDLTVAHPEWYSTVDTANQIAIIAFGLCMVGLIAADYYAGE